MYLQPLFGCYRIGLVVPQNRREAPRCRQAEAAASEEGGEADDDIPHQPKDDAAGEEASGLRQRGDSLPGHHDRAHRLR